MTGNGFITLPSAIRTTPEVLDYGRVYLDSSRTLQFTVTNVGRDTLAVTAFQFSDSRFSTQFSGDLIFPGQARSYQVTLRAQTLGQAQALLTIINSDPLRTRIEVPLRANITTVPPMELRIEPQSLSFGQVQRGQTSLKWFYLVNPTGIPLTAWQMTAGAPFSLRTDSVQVAPHDSSRVEVEFTPQAVGSVSGLVRMRTNVLNRDTVTVALSGEGTAPPSPSLSFTPASIDFGAVVVGASTSAGVGLTNRGPGELTVTALETSNSIFGVQNRSILLPAGASQSIQVSFTPRQLGVFHGSLTIRSNDPSAPAATISLTGAGLDTTGKAALMSLSTRTLNLGQTLVQLSSSSSFQIGNLGKDTLRLSSINPNRAEFKDDPEPGDSVAGGQPEHYRYLHSAECG